jgi:(E)-4-hydroxy-3-methyl-but-2-enyl pyrophosphate reductase
VNIKFAKTAGFCMGVRRAVDLVLKAANTKKEPLYTYGPLIHNPQIIDLLEQKGVSVLTDPSSAEPGTVLIRAHGVPPQVKDSLKKMGFTVVDATCPRVIKVQTIIQKYAQQGYHTIIVGDKNHPEVIGLLGYTEDRGIVVSRLQDIPTMPVFDRAVVVAQTTQDAHLFSEIAKALSTRFPHYKVFNTICDSTIKRQLEIREMAKEVDAIIVVGGHNSGNTKRLAQIGKNSGVPTFHIETDADLDPSLIEGMHRIGITAGASTPTWVISKVFKALENLPHEGKIGWRSAIHKIQRTLLLSNLYVSLGAGCLSLACALLLGIEPTLSTALMAAFYVLSMHIMNRFTNKEAKRYNDPDRAGFDEKFKGPLLAMATCSGAIGLTMAFFLGIKPFLILLVMSILGLLYNIKIVPGDIRIVGRFQKIKDIPGSKTFLIAAAWGVVTVILPALTASPTINPSIIFVFIWTSVLVFIRSAIFDIVDTQGDRIVGQETLPIVLGEKQTLRLLKILLVLLNVTVPAGYALGMVSSFGFPMLLCVFYLAGILTVYERYWMFPGFRFEFLVESGFILSGLIAAAWMFMK